MKFNPHFTGYFVIIFLIDATRGRFLAVSSLVGYEKFYLEPWFVYNENLSPEMKQDICTDVVGSRLFDTLYQVDPVNPRDEILYLREKYPHIYEDIFAPQNSSEELVYTNPFRERDVIVNRHDTVHEHMFTCLGICRRSKAIIEYFVSRTHRVNYLSHKRYEDIMKGVFVFAYDENKELGVIALAEEPAYIIDPSDSKYNESFMSGFEDRIIGIHGAHTIAGTICGLSMYDRIRLCTLVLNAETYRKEVTFMPSKDNIDLECHRGAVHFDNTSADFRTVEPDWMIGCKSTVVGTKNLVTYYISAGFQSLEYFLCMKAGEAFAILGGVSCRYDGFTIIAENFDDQKASKLGTGVKTSLKAGLFLSRKMLGAELE